MHPCGRQIDSSQIYAAFIYAATALACLDDEVSSSAVQCSQSHWHTAVVLLEYPDEQKYLTVLTV